MILEGRILDPLHRTSYMGRVVVEHETIVRIERDDTVSSTRCILPGFVDAHVHVESSMLIPSEFARLAVVHGTVATVSDPHEIGNVSGIPGVRMMIDNGAQVPFTFAFGAPSCVPATIFETAGAEITAQDIRTLFEDERVRYLSEMMNFPGVLHEDPMVMEKLRVAKECGRVIDGHAPGLRGDDARTYASHGISTDHECFTLPEALDKIEAGMKIIIREGSAARNYDALHTLLRTHPDVVMFCSDDKHPDSLVEGHINELVKRSLAHGYDLMHVLRAACVHPVQHYGLPVGLLQEGDPADFIVIDGTDTFNVLQTYVKGQLVAENGHTLITRVPSPQINNFQVEEINVAALRLAATKQAVRVIEALDGQLITNEINAEALLVDGQLCSNVQNDVLKIVVVNRYAAAPPAIAFIKNLGLQRGALASSVAHDSHNIVAVGVDDADIAAAINAVIRVRGGVSVSADGITDVLPLPVGGLMSDGDGYDVARQYSALDARVKELGSKLRAPFMTVSFMALLVIPALKLSDKGLFNGTSFSFTNVVLD
ncbi:adenine deaminase [soil metagenome]